SNRTCPPSKLALPVTFLLCGLMVIGCSIQSAEAKPGRVCAMYCLNGTYMTCPPKDPEKLPPACNCCLAKKRGCTIYLSDGGALYCMGRLLQE
uniref:Uncharacterized protein n=1 Tax=Setaria italica TaxID=4555 RepID=K4AKH4_SETIT